MIKNNYAYYKAKELFIPVLCFILSWWIVAFGQPARSSPAGICAGAFGYALFLIGFDFFKGKKARFLVSFSWFFSVMLIQLSWMSSTEYQGNYIYAVYFFMSAGVALQFSFLLSFLRFGEIPDIKKILFLCASWTLLEWSRLFFISGFPFVPAGLALSSTDYGRLWASLGGIYLLSFWVLFTNLVVYRLFRRFSFGQLTLAFSVIFLPYGYGAWQTAYHRKKMEDPSIDRLHVLLVQTSLTPGEKTGFSGYEKMIPPLEQWAYIFSYLAPYREQKTDLIVLPERTVPFSDSSKIYPSEDISFLAEYFFREKGKTVLSSMSDEGPFTDNAYLTRMLAKIFDCRVIIGLENVVKDTKEEFEAYASAFCFYPDGTFEKYDKRVLLPIVEYIPFEWCRKIAGRYNIFGWYRKGEREKTFSGTPPVSPSVCVEELYTELIRKNRLAGGRVFANLTNDVWYPHSKLPQQHFTHGLLRAAENGVPVVRSCNTGITAAIDALGREIAVFRRDYIDSEAQRGCLSVQVPLYDYKTPYLFCGDKPLLLLCMGYVVTFFIRTRFSSEAAAGF